jgi:signal transduction histidine kinase/HAMP domain-containing protein
MISGWSIRQRLVLTVLAISGLIVAATVLITLQTNGALLQRQREATLNAQSDAFARQLDEQLRGFATTPLLIADILSDPALSPIPTLWRTASSIMQDQPLIDRIHILRPYRAGYQTVTFRRSYSVNPLAPMADDYVAQPPDQPWVVDTLNEQTIHWGTITPSSSTVATQYVVAAPYRTLDDQQSGVVWIDINARALREQIQAVIGTTAVGDYHLVVARSGMVGVYGLPMGMTDRSGVLPINAMSNVMLQAWIAQLPSEGGIETADPMQMSPNLPSYIVANTLTTNDWRLISVFSPDTLRSAQNESALFVLLLGAIGLVVLGVVVYNMVKALVSEPLMRISTAAQEIGSGDMRYHIPYTGRSDEVGSLAHALQGMQSSLSDTYGKLSVYGRTLETRVQERTKEAEHAREAAQDNAAELRSLYDASIEIVSEYQLDVMLQKMVSYMQTLLRAGYCSVWLLADDARQLKLVATTPEHRHVVGVVVTANEGLAGRVVRTRKGMIVDDYTNWTGRIGWIMPQMHRAVAVPLIYSGSAIGAVIAGRGPMDRPFNESEQRLLNLLANVVSPIVRNAQLYAQLDVAKQQAEAANEVKTRFLAGVTHELRTPLNLVINNMDFMRVGMFGEVNDEQRERLDQTIRSAEHLLYLINDLLDVSKIEAGEMELSIEPSELYPVLVDALDAAIAMMPADSRVTLSADFPDELPQLSMDARRIRQVLLNLLSNAIKFTQEGEIVFQVRVTDERVEFAVADTGMGIAPDELDAIFQPFERTHRSKSLNIEGTGLGLPISRYLVQAHGGELEVVTEVGKGSVFRFSLPLHPKEKRRTGTAKAAV